MAYNEKLAERIRKVVGRRRNITERKMFGGVAFMLSGNMCCGVVGDKLCLRLGEEAVIEALQKKNTSPMDFTGKPLKTMVYVQPAGIRTEPSLRRWIDQAVDFAKSLPKK